MTNTEKNIKQERIMARHALDGKFGSAIKKLKIMDSKKIKKMIKEDKDGVFARLSKK